MKFISSLLFFTIFISLASAQTIKTITHKPEKVTIFLNQALIEQSLSLTLPAGKVEVKIEDIASTINVSSIKASGMGDFTLLGIQYNPNHISTKATSLQDSLNQISQDLEYLQMLLGVANHEETMIMANANIKSEQDGLAPEELKEMILVFREKLADVGQTKLNLKKKIKKIEEKRQAFQKQFEAYAINSQRGVISLNLSVNKATTARIDLAYLAYGAQWTPSYDIRVKDLKSEVELLLKADIAQNTGIDFENVKLSLSTGNPSLGGIKPELNPVYLSFYQPRLRKEKSALDDDVVVGYATNAKANQSEEIAVETDSMVMAASPAESTVVQEGLLDLSYDIKDAYTFKTGAKPETVEIQKYGLPSTYETVSVPLYEKNAYLMANINSFKNLSLLAGEANVFFNNGFVGKSYLTSLEADSVLSLSLGRDSRVLAKRELLSKNRAKKSVGSNVKETFEYMIQLRNQKNETINLKIEDQIPLSQDKDIEVEVENLSAGVLDPATGKVTWRKELGPLDYHTLILKYTVRYPKDKKVNNL
jgi:uncharacterized protein (TIGR02231 family)